MGYFSELLMVDFGVHPRGGSLSTTTKMTRVTGRVPLPFFVIVIYVRLQLK